MMALEYHMQFLKLFLARTKHNTYDGAMLLQFPSFPIRIFTNVEAYLELCQTSILGLF